MLGSIITPLFLVACALALLAPCPAAAQDPGTTLVIIGQVVKITGDVIKTVDALSADRSSDKWQKEVSDQLNRVINQNNEILSEIRSLKVFIPSAIGQKLHEEAVKNAVSLSNRLGVYMADSPPRRKLIQEMRGSTEQVTFNLFQDDPSYYQAADAAAILTLGVYKASGDVTKPEKRAFIRVVTNKMQEWASTAPGMFGAVAQEQGAIAAQKMKELHRFQTGTVMIFQAPASYEEGIRPNGFPHLMHCTLKELVTVSIDFKNLSQSVGQPDDDGCGKEASFDHGEDESRRSERIRQIQGVIDAIKNAQAQERTAQEHSRALHRMISDLQGQD